MEFNIGLRSALHFYGSLWHSAQITHDFQCLAFVFKMYLLLSVGPFEWYAQGTPKSGMGRRLYFHKTFGIVDNIDGFVQDCSKALIPIWCWNRRGFNLLQPIWACIMFFFFIKLFHCSKLGRRWRQRTTTEYGIIESKKNLKINVP